MIGKFTCGPGGSTTVILDDDGNWISAGDRGVTGQILAHLYPASEWGRVSQGAFMRAAFAAAVKQLKGTVVVEPPPAPLPDGTVS